MKDPISKIMDEWYETMAKNNISVQPKASTILGTILAKHFNSSKEDVFDRYMNTKAGDHDAFWQSLSTEEKAYCEERRQKLRDEYYSKRGLVNPNSKTLLKG